MYREEIESRQRRSRRRKIQPRRKSALALRASIAQLHARIPRHGFCHRAYICIWCGPSLNLARTRLNPRTPTGRRHRDETFSRLLLRKALSPSSFLQPRGCPPTSNYRGRSARKPTSRVMRSTGVKRHSGRASERRNVAAPTFRDINVQPGRRYFYRVPAVDHAGNESPMSSAVIADVP